jgi:hypothetical protein
MMFLNTLVLILILVVDVAYIDVRRYSCASAAYIIYFMIALPLWKHIIVDSSLPCNSNNLNFKIGCKISMGEFNTKIRRHLHYRIKTSARSTQKEHHQIHL